jgi:hypothetical protein
MIRAFSVRQLLDLWEGIPISEAVRSLSLVSRVMGAHNIQVFKERKHGLALGFSLPSGGSGSCECNIHVMTISSYNSANSYGQEWNFH